jgi:WD40 repeat protein
VSKFATFYGRNGHVLDPTYRRLESSFEIDAAPREWSLSPEGRFLSLIAKDEVLCVRDLKENRELFFQGQRVLKKPDVHTFVIDAPFFSHIRSDGRTVLYTQGNSWATGKVFVHDLATKKTNSFDARNGHIELSVHFPSRRLVVTGTGAGLTLTDFTGVMLADLKDATLQRNGCVEFSPSGKRIVVGSWDNAVYAFEIVE